MMRVSKLADFLADAFKVDELKRFVDSLGDDQLVKEVDWKAAVAEVSFEVADKLRARGLVDEQLWSRLVEARPRRAAEIRALQELVAGTGPGGTVRPWGTAVPPPPPSPHLRDIKPSHTSIVIDRRDQWRTLLSHCAAGSGHAIFLLHGTVEQDLLLFLERIRQFVSEESRSHRVIDVPYRDGDSRAATAKEWSQSVRRAARYRMRSLAECLQNEAKSRSVLLILSDRKRPLGDLPQAHVGSLAGFLTRELPAALERAQPKHPYYVVVPLEHEPQDGGALHPTVEAIDRALSGGPLPYVPLLELTFPGWPEVRSTIREEHQGIFRKDAPGELLDRCHECYQRLAGPGRSLLRLGEELHELIDSWDDG